MIYEDGDEMDTHLMHPLSRPWDHGKMWICQGHLALAASAVKGYHWSFGRPAVLLPTDKE